MPDPSEEVHNSPEDSLARSSGAADKASDAEAVDGIPMQPANVLPVVGLGGSAGCIEPLQKFFSNMPADSGMGFVVILHLAPELESRLPQVLQRCTKMPVLQAEHGQHVEANHVYVIPPGKQLKIVDGELQLTEMEAVRGKRGAIDHFFRTLADTHGSRAVAIVLSGRDGDGSIGLKRIKELGGLTVVQEPTEAESAEMPESAIATGMVDWILPVSEMPGRLMGYQGLEGRVQLPPEEGPLPSPDVQPEIANGEKHLREILAILRIRTGRDFSYYKRATILRRIARRMRVNGIESLEDYLEFVRTHVGEASSLLQDLLISVTNFFRDHGAFEKLKEQIPAMFQGQKSDDSIRVWIAACATGEEAYSIAMLLHEYKSNHLLPQTIQVFATDLDAQAIQTAREGLYPDSIATDVPEELLRRYFVREHRSFRVKRELRESVLFAVHDLLRDPPFSRLDLISCRNLLIYLNREAQGRLFTIFHFALKPNGKMFLGSSDSVEDGSPLFSVCDKKARIYAPRMAARAGLPMPVISGISEAIVPTTERTKGNVAGLSNWTNNPKSIALPPRDSEESQSIPWSELHYRMIDYFAPPSLIVDAEYKIMHLSESARRFLRFTGGEPTRNLLRVVNPMLRAELRAVLFRATQTQAIAEVHQVPVEMDGESQLVNIRVSPASDIAPNYLLVIFDTCKAPADASKSPSRPTDVDSATGQLERELESVKGRLRDVVEQYEASTEELKASNEELQAMNEELRSATEELETSREELQSINEELTTVNGELKSNVDELGNANSDLRNLMASTAIATVFLDREQCITRFTPAAVEIFNLIPTDVGRPLADLAHRLDYPDLKSDADNVLAQLTPIEREVSRQGKEWYLARLLPYRATDDRIGGLVLTFVNITERRKNEEALRESAAQLRSSEARLQMLFSLVPAGIYSCDHEGRIDFFNQHAALVWGEPPTTLTRFCGFKTIRKEGAPPMKPEETPMADAVRHGKPSRYTELIAENSQGKVFLLSQNIAPILSAAGKPIGAVNVFLDISELKTAEKALREAKVNLEGVNLNLEKRISDRTAKLNETVGELEAFSYTIAHDMRAPLRSIQGFSQLLLDEKGAGLDSTAQDYLRRIKSASTRLDRLILDVLSYSRIVRQELKLERVDTTKLLGEILESYPNLRQSVADIIVEQSMPKVWGNSAALTQVFSNILGNAVKFAKPGTKPQIKIHSEKIESFVRIWFEDNGIGIDPAIHERIFELFQQVEPGSHEGAGVGLAIVRKAVERMNGRVGVKSAINEGSSFWIELKPA